MWTRRSQLAGMHENTTHLIGEKSIVAYDDQNTCEKRDIKVS